MKEAADRGVHHAVPLTDVHVRLIAARYHTVDSSSQDFAIASSLALKHAVRAASPLLLEPIMRIDVRTRIDKMGAVLADVKRRRGKVLKTEIRGEICTIHGEAPLAEARGYATDLRDMTEGRGTFSLEFSRFHDCPAHAVNEESIRQRG